MKKLFLFLAIIATPIFFLCNKLPSIKLNKLNGGTINLSEISNDGKPMLVCVWEVSCLPCTYEFNAISASYEDWKKETGVKVVAISIDDNRNYSRVFPLVRSKGWSFEFYQDKNQEIKRAMGVQYCPYTFVVDGKGEIVWSKGGYVSGDEKIAYGIIQKIAKGEKIN